MSFAFANPGSGPSAGGIGWFNFGQGFTITPNQVYTNLTGTLLNGITVTFDLKLKTLSGAPANFAATTVPNGSTYFGNATGGYTGLSTSYVELLSTYPGAASQMSFELTNIIVRDANNVPLSNYSGVVVDAQTTTSSVAGPETQTYITNGGAWVELVQLGNTNPPTLNISGQTASLVGTGPPVTAVYVLTTTSPTAMTLNVSWPNTQSTQGIAFGFAASQMETRKIINGRRNALDQFVLNIGGFPSSSVTTSGATNGLQSIVASSNVITGNAYTINELMAPGSVSTLSDYSKTITGVNITPGGTQPVISPLPETVTPILGDIIKYTITNTPNPIATKMVSSMFAKSGDTLTYTVSVTNPGTIPATNVVVVDAVPSGTTFANGLTVSVPFTGSNPASGITLTSIPAGGIATVSWNVTVNSGIPPTNPISNQATISGAGYSYNTNTVATQVNFADVTVLKTVDKAFAGAGEIMTYTLQLGNLGNVNANSITLMDAIPNGTTFVPGSVTGATGIPPSLTLAAPINPGGSAIITFQVKMGDSVPSPNPVSNTATANYSYTVDPAVPNGATGSKSSNTVTTLVNIAKVSTTKAVNLNYAEIAQILTYTLTVNNSGNTAANNVTITDAVPSGTTFVIGSVTGAIGVPPVLTLATPLAPGSTTTVTFQVLVGNTLPVPNPIVNTGNTSFVYTVDPALPNGASGIAPTNSVATQINDANLNTIVNVDKTVSDLGEVLTYTITLKNDGNVPLNNVVLNDPISAGTTYINGSLIGATGVPSALNIPDSIPVGGSTTLSYQVLVGNSVPVPNPISQTATAAFTFTVDPANPNGQTGTSNANTVNTLVSSAIIETTKKADKAFADVGDTITYTITITNSGNVAANNVVITDAIPTGTTFVLGSLVNATGTPPTMTLNAPVPASGNTVVSFQVLVGSVVPIPNPVENSAIAAFTYTVDSTHPNGATGISYSDSVQTQINTAKLVMQKSVDKTISYLSDTITYQISVTNTGNVSANNVVVTDILPAGTAMVAGSMIVSVSYVALSSTVLQLTNPLSSGETITILFKVLVTAIPNPNPIVNMASASYTYTTDSQNPNSVSAKAKTNAVTTAVFRNNFSQQISDLIQSVALEQAALAAIANSEGAKIQRMVIMDGVTNQELLCLNKSVSDMLDSLTMLETVLKQKLRVASCQIDGTIC